MKTVLLLVGTFAAFMAAGIAEQQAQRAYAAAAIALGIVLALAAWRHEHR